MRDAVDDALLPKVDSDESSPEATAQWILWIALALVGIGTVFVFSTSAALPARDHGMDAAYRALWIQLAKVGAGLVFLWAGLKIRIEWLCKYRWRIWAGVLIALALVFVPGVGMMLNGARRWLQTPLVPLQPSEFVKLAVVVLVAGTCGRIGTGIEDWRKGLLPVYLALGIAALLLLKQPDFGSALFVLGLGTLLMLLGGARAKHFLIAGACALPLCIAYAVLRLDHVQRRLTEYVSPSEGGQAYQSMIALGNGGAFGAGLGAGEAKLGYLPYISSDFILAAVGEELGFVGTSLVVLLFVVLLLLGTRVVMRQQSIAGFVLAAGLTLLICVQALINVAVVTAAVPTKGIALPYLSAGGSSICAMLFATGLLANLARRAGEPIEVDDVESDRARFAPVLRRLLGVRHG